MVFSIPKTSVKQCDIDTVKLAIDAFSEAFDALEAVHLEFPYFDHVASVSGFFEVGFGLVAFFHIARSDDERLDAEIEDFDCSFEAKTRCGTCQNDDLASEGHAFGIDGRGVLHLKQTKEGCHDEELDSKASKNKFKKTKYRASEARLMVVCGRKRSR